MKFPVGNLVCSISGSSRIVEDFKRAVSFAEVDSPDCDIMFDFIDELPAWQNREFVSLDSFDITADRVRVADRSFVFEAVLGEKPIRVLVVPARNDLLRKIHHTIKKSWRYFHTHGCGLYITLSDLFITFICR